MLSPGGWNSPFEIIVISWGHGQFIYVLFVSHILFVSK
jgi:hypothetical protein